MAVLSFPLKAQFCLKPHLVDNENTGSYTSVRTHIAFNLFRVTELSQLQQDGVPLGNRRSFHSGENRDTAITEQTPLFITEKHK